MARTGRPSLYSPAYCEEVIAAGDEGLSLAAFAGRIGVARDTITEWQNEHPEFSAAVKKHKAKRALIWEQRLARQAEGGAGKPVCTIFALKNLAGEDWKDLHVVGGDKGTDPIQLDISLDEVARVLKPELEKQLAEILGKLAG